MQLTCGLLLDFGNSQTRVAVITGNRVLRFNLSNRFAELPAGYKISTKYRNDKSTVFKHNDVYFANGQIVEREFSGLDMRPSALESKTVQMVTELTINLAMVKTLMLLSTAYNKPVKELSVTFNISTLLPPLDHEKYEDEMVEKLKSMTSVTSFLPQDFTSNFSVQNVGIFAEAVSAFFGAFYEEKGANAVDNTGRNIDKGDVIVYDNNENMTLSEVENNRDFMNGYVLILDIGAGTTDVALFKDMELIDRSRETFKLGGNTVESIIRNDVKKKYGFTPQSVQRIVAEGVLEEGSELHDVSAIVTQAKEYYSRAVMEELTQYLERMMVDMPNVKGLLLAGGGALPSVRDGQVVSPAMSEVLLTYLQKLASRLMPVNVEGRNLRELNIDGLIIMHKYS